MDLTQTRNLEAPCAAVWAALNDLVVLKDCIPGCESLESEGHNAFHAVVAVRIGPVRARFNGHVQLTDLIAPTAYTLRFEGQGGAAGFASGEARVTLAPASPASTALTYIARAQIGGKLAQLGSRLVDGVAAKLADDFFARLAERVVMPPDAVVPPAEIAALVPATATRVAPGGGTAWVRYAVTAGIIAVLVVLYVYYQR